MVVKSLIYYLCPWWKPALLGRALKTPALCGRNLLWYETGEIEWWDPCNQYPSFMIVLTLWSINTLTDFIKVFWSGERVPLPPSHRPLHPPPTPPKRTLTVKSRQDILAHTPTPLPPLPTPTWSQSRLQRGTNKFQSKNIARSGKKINNPSSAPKNRSALSTDSDVTRLILWPTGV